MTNPLEAYLKDILVDGNTLFIDNSRLESFTHCPRKGQYTILQKRIPTTDKAALTFGKHIHTALEYRYRFFGTGQLTHLQQKKLLSIFEELYSITPVPEDDHRQCSFAQLVMDTYLRTHPSEKFSIIDIGGKPVIEQSFACEIGTINGIKIIWTGRMDLGIELDKRLVVLDHKTTSMGGEGYFSEFYTSNALKGYAFALGQISGRPCNTAIINALICRKATTSGKGKGMEMLRSNLITFENDTLLEWRESVLAIIEDFFANIDRGFFPMHTKHCVGKFGRCDMFDVCTLPPSSRYAMLNSSLYTVDKWNPLHANELDLAEFHSRSFNPDQHNFPSPTKPKATTTSYDITDLLS